MTNADPLFYLQKENIYAMPAIHYNMEMAAHAHLLFQEIQPDCVAVELAETMQLQLLHGASRLPDISLAITYDQNNDPLYYMCEPCDAAFEGLRSALEAQVPAYCIDLDVDFYPDIREPLPDPYAIHRIGLKAYYEVYKKTVLARRLPKPELDMQRELYMAKRLKELSLTYDRVLFIGGMAHVDSILKLVERTSFPPLHHAERGLVELCTLSEPSCREVMAECGWFSGQYEELRTEYAEPSCREVMAECGWFSGQYEELRTEYDAHRTPGHTPFPPNRQKLIYQLYKASATQYKTNTTLDFPGYNFRNIMKFARNYALITNQLMPDLYQILTAAKGCVDSNYAYETWETATEYPYRRNVDGLPELDLTIKDVWGHSKILRFHLRQPSRKGFKYQRRRKDQHQFRFEPPGPFSICSYPPEDVVIEDFGEFLKKKGTQIFSEEGARSAPFTSSLEDGIDTRETVRHWPERKLYVKIRGKPPSGVGSVVVIFEEDTSEEDKPYKEKYPWHTTWLGEHAQESDMSFYATPMGSDVVGPGISRCNYGGFMMSYPPRRMFDIWHDPDYEGCRTKAEVLLMAAIDYAVTPAVVYVASTPPRSAMKSFAQRFGKKIVYIPIGQLSAVMLNRIRIFHVLDGHDKRNVADEYIM